jgi:hypothetical protein
VQEITPTAITALFGKNQKHHGIYELRQLVDRCTHENREIRGALRAKKSRKSYNNLQHRKYPD